MAMPRPSDKALKIAEQCVPGLYRSKKSKGRSKVKSPRASMSEVEIKQTNNIENKEGLR